MEGQSGEGNRRERRSRVLKSAHIIFNGGYSTYDCRVKNLSARGALLLAPTLLGIPSHFDLVIEKGEKPRPCTVMWRTDTLMGVSFDATAEQAA